MDERDSLWIHPFSFDEVSGDDILERCQAVHGHGLAEKVFHLANFRTGNYPEERTIVSDHDAFEWQSARGGNQRPRDAGQIIDLASDQGGGLDRAGQLDKVDVETILLVDVCVLGNKEDKKREAKSG